jgi:hypothetical protein
MDIIVKYARSAFKHGVSEADIRHAINNSRYDDVFEDDVDKNLLLGFDCNANLLEILYNIIDERNIKVFHAMKCRNGFLDLIEE